MAVEGKSRIIDAAKQVISKQGINGATMRAIAEEANLSTGAIYHYYSSKEQILYDVMDESLSVSSRIAEEAHQDESSKEEIVKEIYENIIERFKKTSENKLQFYLAQEAILGNAELKEKFGDKYKEWIDKIEDLMRSLYGKKPSKHDRALASLLIAAIDGIGMQLLLGANQSQIDDIAAVYNKLLTKGIPELLDLMVED